MVEKNSSLVSYVFGIISIVMAFFNSPAGLVFGIIGLVQAKKQKTELSKKAKKLNIIGIVLSGVLLIASVIATYYLAQNMGTLPGFPLA